MRTAGNGKPTRQRTCEQMLFGYSIPQPRAAILVEARSPRDDRQVAEVFDLPPELAAVRPLATGAVRAFAIKALPEPDLIAKLGEIVKTKFCFSVIERSFTAHTQTLIATLCEQTEGRLLPVPTCALCDTADPFPSWVEFLDSAGKRLALTHYCEACAQKNFDPELPRFMMNLTSRSPGAWSGLPPVSRIEAAAKRTAPRLEEVASPALDPHQRVIAIAI